jgi:hypothetical protein
LETNGLRETISGQTGMLGVQSFPRKAAAIGAFSLVCQAVRRCHLSGLRLCLLQPEAHIHLPVQGRGNGQVLTSQPMFATVLI